MIQKLRWKRSTTTWIYFPNLLHTLFVKECLFTLVATVGNPLQVDTATLNRTRSSCARVKVQVDLNATMPKYAMMEIEDEETKAVRVETIKIQYDFFPKYCKRCRLQGHGEDECRILHHELRRIVEDKGKRKEESETRNHTSPAKDKNNKVQNKTLSSGKVVGPFKYHRNNYKFKEK